MSPTHFPRACSPRSFHKICAYIIFICSLGHTMSHVANYTLWTSSKPSAWQAIDMPQPTTHSLWTNRTTVTGACRPPATSTDVVKRPCPCGGHMQQKRLVTLVQTQALEGLHPEWTTAGNSNEEADGNSKTPACSAKLTGVLQSLTAV